MSKSVFEQLAERFSECRVDLEAHKKTGATDAVSLLYRAGEVLFAKIGLGEIELGNVPPWFRKKPEATRTDREGNDGVYYCWDFYWLAAVKWLAKNKPESVIVDTSEIYRLKPEDNLHSGEDVYGFLVVMLRLRDEYLERACLHLARASKAACLYLGRGKVTPEPAETERDAKRTIAAIVISLFADCIFVLSVWLVPFTPFSWLKNHPNSYGLEGAIVLLVPCIFVGLLRRQYRKWCWKVALFALVLLILSLLGGPRNSNVE